VKAVEKIVYLVGENMVPVEATMKTRKSKEQMELEFPHSSIFLRNKNLHGFPRHARGAIVWLSFPMGAIIAVVIRQTGSKGIVVQ
jgi:hypothetical protein